VRSALARLALETLKKEAAEADTTDEEIATATARHFVEFDRPEAFRVVHAVVRVADGADAAAKTRAKTVASRLAEHLAKARVEAEFRTLAESFQDRDGFELVVDAQKPVAADGRVVDVEHPTSGETYVLPFARAAARLGQPGQKSGVVSTEYGFHVMMLLERTPPHAVPLDERRRLLRDEIVTDRARRSKKELLSRIRSNVSTSVERSADALLATVDVGGHENP
jgi:peptidyl-prolyl cis-trans isomerase C